MTCRDLGGPCELAHRGNTADEIIKAQDRHVKEMVAGGDSTHVEVNAAMRERWRHPIAGMGWYRARKREFANRPDDGADLGAGAG